MAPGVRPALLLPLLFTVLLAGCLTLGAPEIHTRPGDEMTLSRGETKQLEVSAENNGDTPARFSVAVHAPDFVDMTTIDGDPVTGPVALGEAAANSNTNKKVLLLALNEQQMQDEDWNTAEYDLVLELHSQTGQATVTKTLELHVRNRENGLL